ncbi:MAG TPA: hypothetical protein VMJ75_21300 [Candidatus Acidoferrales bacterium]|nr:hypothetical protein [Candidatus Acidoferrales bacterium]
MNDPTTSGGFPTLLLAELDEKVCAALSLKLRDEGYNVLEAPDWDSALRFIRTHSRPIHFLLANGMRAGTEVAETLKPYRPDMRVLFVSQQPLEDSPRVYDTDSVLNEVMTHLKPVKSAQAASALAANSAA